MEQFEPTCSSKITPNSSSDNCLTPNAELQRVERDESKMRSEITKLLELCLRTQDKKSDMSNFSIWKLACMLEKRLYKSAISFESYCDLQTLESRMRVVLYHLRNQQQAKKRHSQTSRQVLKQKIGLQDYERAELLVSEIHHRKISLAGQSCGSCRSRKSCSPFEVKPFTGQLPAPVKDLFFGTPLLDVFQKYEVKRIQSLSSHQILRSIEQAERRMAEFDAWRNKTAITAVRNL